jgi:glycosyltransferase involved in cell wall biosynthesis
MKASVLIATYNQLQYIEKAIESVLSQETEYEYEIIISDDCSTDGTQEILSKFKNNHPDKIKLILNETNQGINTNYFSALKACKGEFIFFCEGDDYWTNNHKIDEYVGQFDNNAKANVLFSRVNYIDVKGNTTGTSRVEKESYNHLDILRHSTIPGLSSVGVRNNFQENLGQWFVQCSTPDSIIYLLASKEDGILLSKNTVDSCYRLGSGLWSNAEKNINDERNLVTLNVLENVFVSDVEQKIIKRRKLNLYYSLAIHFRKTDSSKFKENLNLFNSNFTLSLKNALKRIILYFFQLSK